MLLCQKAKNNQDGSIIRSFDVDLVVFDNDSALIDFYLLRDEKPCRVWKSLFSDSKKLGIST